MNRKFFLPPFLIYFLYLINFIIFIIFSFSTFLFFALLTGFVFFLFRKHKFIYRDRIKRNENIYISPVNGTIERITKNVEIDSEKYTEVIILVSFFHEWGLYLPMSCEVDQKIESKGMRLFRFGEYPKKLEDWSHKKHNFIQIRSKEQKTSLINIYPCLTGLKPQIWPISGDRGLSAACFGMLTLGGVVHVFLLHKSNLFFEDVHL